MNLTLNEDDNTTLEVAYTKARSLLTLLHSEEAKQAIAKMQWQAKKQFNLPELPKIEAVSIPSYNIERFRVTLTASIVDFDVMLEQADVSFTASDASTMLYAMITDQLVEDIEAASTFGIEIVCTATAVLPEDVQNLLRGLGKIQWHTHKPAPSYEAFSC